METDQGANPTSRGSLASDHKLSEDQCLEGLIVGVVTEAETSLFNETTLINVQTGEKDNFLLLLKNSAGFLVGRVVVFDADCTSIRWIENEMYSFKILGPVKFPKTFNVREEDTVECPECHTRVKAKNLAKHFRKKHHFMML